MKCRYSLLLDLLASSLLAFGLLLCSCTNSTESPNIILLLADDLGYGDLGCYGGIAQTRNLDKLASRGARFTDFYAAAPNCSPSRAGLLTGRSPTKVGIYSYLPENHPMHLRDEEITLAELAREKGYQTAHFGKWHLGCLPQNPRLNQPQPDDQGFNYSFGTANNAYPTHLNPVNFVLNGDSVGELQGYSCDILVNKAISWVEMTAGNEAPYFMYIAFHEPHKVIASPPELIDKYAQYGFQNAEYFASVENMDRAVGKLLRAIKEDIEKGNTIILFASDNGSYRTGSNGNLLGGKSFVYEGGIRVPGIFYWEGKIAANQTIYEPVGLIDFMPTICHLLEMKHPHQNKLDGQNFWPLLINQKFERKKPLNWFFYRTSPEMAMRIDRFTILGRDLDTTKFTHAFTAPDMHTIKQMTLEDFSIYDLKADPGQANKITVADLPQGKNLKETLLSCLQEIQSECPEWHGLPPAVGTRKLKSEWRQLRPKGFSN